LQNAEQKAKAVNAANGQIQRLKGILPQRPDDERQHAQTDPAQSISPLRITPPSHSHEPQCNHQWIGGRGRLQIALQNKLSSLSTQQQEEDNHQRLALHLEHQPPNQPKKEQHISRIAGVQAQQPGGDRKGRVHPRIAFTHSLMQKRAGPRVHRRKRINIIHTAIGTCDQDLHYAPYTSRREQQIQKIMHQLRSKQCQLWAHCQPEADPSLLAAEIWPENNR